MNVPFRPEKTDATVQVVRLPEYGAEFVLNPVDGTVRGEANGPVKVIGFDLEMKRTRRTDGSP